jgi:HlyD family secretion protein
MQAVCHREYAPAQTALFTCPCGVWYTVLLMEGSGGGVSNEALADASRQALQLPDVHKRGRTQRIVAVVAVLGALIVGFVVYRDRSRPNPEIYRTVEVTRRDVIRVIEATGHLDARSRFEVPPPYPARLAQIAVKEGDRVAKGQLLARLDDRSGSFAVQNAGASKEAATWRMAEARTALDAAREEQKRIQRLAERGLASKQEVAAAANAVARAHAASEAARAETNIAAGQLASAKFERNLGDVIAPIDGVVLSAPENLGTAVSPEHSLFVIGEPLELMRVDVDVGEADIGEVRVGQNTSFEVQTFPGRTFGARVERVGVEPKREGSVISYPVLLIADNRDGALLPGMTAAVKLEVARAANVLTVREGALRFVPNDAEPAASRTRVFRHVGPSRLEPVMVTPGLSDGVYTEVKPSTENALSEHDQVAVGLLRPDAALAAGAGQPGISLGKK